jgi:SSS family solute:Na+ symporter
VRHHTTAKRPLAAFITAGQSSSTRTKEGYAMNGTTWVYIMLGVYIVYCFYWGLKGYFTEKTSSGYAIAGRSIPFFAFLMAATAASFSGWTFVGHPGQIWSQGMAYAFASFYVLTIPITGAFFAKRNWLIGKALRVSSPRATCSPTITTTKRSAG